MRPITDFYWKDKKRGLRRSDCKYCHCAYVKGKYYDAKAFLDDIKTKFKCAKCGDNRSYCLDFHHINPNEKDETLARMTSHQSSKEVLTNEVNKCVVLCSNCHREFHYLERQFGITLEQYLK